MEAAISMLEDRIKGAVAKTAVPSNKSKIPYMGKCIYSNVIIDFTKLFRARGLYPVLSAKCIQFAPHMVIMHNIIVEGISTSVITDEEQLVMELGSNIPSFETVRNAIENNPKVQWTKRLKQLVRKKYAYPPASTQPSSLVWFYLCYQVCFTK